MTKPCPNGCDHTDAEHQAFDAGVQAGIDGVTRNPYTDDELHEVWEVGRSVTAG